MTLPAPGILGQRVLLWSGTILVFVYGLSFVYLLDFVPAPAPTLDADSVVNLYAHSNIKFRFGVVLMIISGAFYLPMSMTIGVQMARLEKGFPYLAILQALASTVGAWIFAFPPVLWGVCAFTVNRSPEITVALHQLAWLCFVTPSSFFYFQLIPIGLVALVGKQDVAHSPFPRWFGWLTLMALVEMDLPPTFAQMFMTGPIAWNGLISFYLTLIIYSIWLLMMIVLIFRSLSAQEKEQRGATSMHSESLNLSHTHG